MGKQEIRDNYIKAKERLANCEKFGIKVICSYIKEGKSETCLEVSQLSIFKSKRVRRN